MALVAVFLRPLYSLTTPVLTKEFLLWCIIFFVYHISSFMRSKFQISTSDYGSIGLSIPSGVSPVETVNL